MKRVVLFVIICLVQFNLVAQSLKTMTGTASFYASKFNGRKTATGEIFSNEKMTCACNQLKLGTMIRVTNLKNNKSIVLKVNDRLAPNNYRLVDVTASAAKQLGFYENGLGKVKIELIEKKSQIQKEPKIVESDSVVIQKKDTIFTKIKDK